MQKKICLLVILIMTFAVPKVYAVDVGQNQLHESLKNNPKVENIEKTNFLDFDNKILQSAQIVVSDLSFVSQTKMAKKFSVCSCQIIILIKPQFECGMVYAKKHKGIVKDPVVHFECIQNVVKAFEKEGLHLWSLDVSPILGGDGNKEFIALFSKNKPKHIVDIKKIVEKPLEL